MSTRGELPATAHRLGLRVAIDGLAGAGKSTVGRGVADELECAYLDTGIMYRAVTLGALHAGLELGDGQALSAIADALSFAWSSDARAHILVDGQPPASALRSPEVDASVSRVSAHARVRFILVERQRELARERCVVMVGRDIGTVVLPDASVKLWITASPEERERRRRRESGREPQGMDVRVHRRDQLDAGRSVSPAVPASDAFVIDTDGLTPDESVAAALDRVRSVIEQEPASAR